ncbi:MAG: zinc-dependent alcohol dehydrogenase [Acidimicrobiia bacterium]
MSDVATAVVLEGPRRLTIRDLPLPEVGQDDGVLRIEACGLCGTDHELYTGALAVGVPIVPGHEVVGVVETIGPRAAEHWSVSVGDRVAVEVFQSCGSCLACRAGDSRHCKRHGLGDSYGFVPVDRAPGLWGGYATHLYLAPDAALHHVPPALDPAVATAFNPLGAGICWAVTLPALQPGAVVAVLGPGIRGLCCAAAAKEAGAAFVMVTGRGAQDESRLGLAARFGADLAVDVEATDSIHALRDATGGLADVVVDVTAKAPDAFAQALALARPGGTIVIAGTRGSDATPGFRPDLIPLKELRILGVLGVDSAAYAAALALLDSGRFPFADLPRRTEPLAGLDDLLATMAGERDVPPVHAVLVP